MTLPVLELEGLSRVFEPMRGTIKRLEDRIVGREPPLVRAVDGVSVSLLEGETLGIVGESGCGKSTLARMIAGILPSSSGNLKYKGEDYSSFLPRRRDALKVQMVFQDPMSSLNPRLKVGRIVGEAAAIHGVVPRSQIKEHVAAMLNKVGLPAESIDRFPHEFSGGQRQRIGIARALAVNPELLVCDEAVAALDVSVQAQIINLLMDIRSDDSLSMIFISHDLGLIRHLCDRVAVMYLGRVVELAPTSDLFANPTHPYTQMLLAGMPNISLERRKFMPIKGEIPSPLNPPPGCHFHPRCPLATDHCRTTTPNLMELSSRHYHACLNVGVPEVLNTSNLRP